MSTLDSIRPSCRSYVEALQDDEWMWPWFVTGCPIAAFGFVLYATIHYAPPGPAAIAYAWLASTVALWSICFALFALRAGLRVLSDRLVRWAWEQRQ